MTLLTAPQIIDKYFGKQQIELITQLSELLILDSNSDFLATLPQHLDNILVNIIHRFNEGHYSGYPSIDSYFNIFSERRNILAETINGTPPPIFYDEETCTGYHDELLHNILNFIPTPFTLYDDTPITDEEDYRGEAYEERMIEMYDRFGFELPHEWYNALIEETRRLYTNDIAQLIYSDLESKPNNPYFFLRLFHSYQGTLCFLIDRKKLPKILEIMKKLYIYEEVYSYAPIFHQREYI